MARNISVEILGDSSSLVNAFQRSSRSAHLWNSNITRASRGALVATVGFRGLGRSIAFASASFVGGAGLIAGVKGSIEAFGGFQEQMQRTVGLASVAQEQVAGFSKEILKLGPAIGKSPQELARAFFFITSSGIESSRAIGVLTASAKASAAGLGSTEVVADALTSAINAYGIENLNAARAADVLATAVKEGKGEADQFAPVIGNVVALASQLGVSFQEVGAALAGQTRLGTDAATTAIQLQRVFTTLLKITPKSREAFEAVGIKVEQLREDLGKKGLLNVLQQVRGAFGSDTDLMAQAFGDERAVRGILNLVGSQMPEVVKVFDNFTRSQGNSERAFKAISKTVNQQFRRLKASGEAAGIALGAIFAPVAGKVASALAEASVKVTDFFNDLNEATTSGAKLKVVFAGAVGIQKAVGDGIRDIDWDKVWAEARGIGDGLQKELEQTDFGFIGQRVGEGITAAIKVAVPAAKDLAERVNEAMREIDFVEFGKRLGPGLAAAVVSAFVTLADPAFWVKNWDLAIAVAATVFRVRILGLAAKIIAPLRRLGGRMVLGIVGGVEAFAPRIASVLLDALLALPAIALRALSPLTRVIARVFERIGKLTKFTVTVLGIQAAVNAVVGFARKVIDTIKGLVKTVSNFFENLWNTIKKTALQAALDIIEPFTHIPGFLGGGAFRDLKDEWQGTLRKMETDARSSTRAIQGSIDGLKGKTVEINIFTRLKTVVENALGVPGSREKDPTRVEEHGRGRNVAKETLEKKTKQDQETQSAVEKAARARRDAAQAAKKAADAAAKALEEAKKAFANVMDALTLGEERATSTKSLRDDIAAQKKIQEEIRAQIRIEGETTELMRLLFQSQQKVRDFEKKIAENKQAAKQKQQFKQLGLTAEGEEITPSAKVLEKKGLSLQERIKGTILDTPKTRKKLADAAKVLSGAFGKVGREVRAAIFQMFQDIAGALDEKKGPLTKTSGLNTKKILAGIGLSEDEINELRGRLSHFNTAGRALAGVPAPPSSPGGFGGASSGVVVIEAKTTVELDGHKVGDAVTRYIQNHKRRNPPQKRGPNRGGAR